MTLGLALISTLAERLPPFEPLAPTEKLGIEGPLAEVIWKWTGTMSPEARLAGALGGVAVVRVMVWRAMPPEAREGAKLAARARLAGSGPARGA